MLHVLEDYSLHPIAGPAPVSLILTKTTIFLAHESFTHWPLPRLQALPPKEALTPPYSDVQQHSIDDIEQIVRLKKVFNSNIQEVLLLRKYIYDDMFIVVLKHCVHNYYITCIL